MGVLLGDTTANGTVNSSDIGQAKANSGQTTTSANFRTDVTANGVINSSDIGTVKANSGKKPRHNSLAMAGLIFMVAPQAGAGSLLGVELVSKADPNQTSATAGALMIPQVNQRAYSADGRYVVFVSSSENLIDGLIQDRITSNVFLHDRVTGSTVLVSHAAGAPTTSPDESLMVPCISGDGRFVVH